MDWFNPNDILIPKSYFIGGQPVDGDRTGPHLDVIRPSDHVTYATLPIASETQVAAVVEQTWLAFKQSDWASRPPRERAKVLFDWAALIEADSDYLAPLEALGSSRPIADVRQWDIPYVVDCIKFFAELADKHGGYVGATQKDRLGLVINEPYGIIGAITPWNFPMSMAVWKVAPALAAGNAVILKPSELTPFTSVRLAELAHQAGVPVDIFNVIQGDGLTTGNALCRHPKISKMTFTGSTQTGAQIMSACALSGPKPATLELGGKSPQVVFADTPDIDKTAQQVAAGITGNAGQVCVSGSRLLVESTIAPVLIEKIINHFRQLTPGSTWQKGTSLPPIISQKQADRIHTIVQQSITAGAICLTGGTLSNAVNNTASGAFYTPTLLKIETTANPAVTEEIFGPVLTVQTFDTEQEAWALASHETYGLAAGIHTADINKALRGVRHLEAGSVWINRYGRSFDHIMPTGGFKRSGIGKDIGKEAFEANQRSKSVLIDFDLD